MRIMCAKTHFMRVGRIAAQQRLSLAQALTNNDAKIDGWITTGFDSMTRKINKREREDLGSPETYDIVKSKLGI